MDKQASQSLTQRLIDRVMSDTSDECDKPMEESADFFLDRARWLQERERYFLKTPQVIGFAGELSEPGSYITTDIVGVPILATRDHDGCLRAFINACAHKGACVASGCGKAKRLTCGFHGWSYDLSGRLVGRAKDECFEPKKDTGLVALPVSDRSGLIMVGLRSSMPQSTIDAALNDIAPAFSGFGFDRVKTLQTQRFEVAANWKLVVSLSLESYHFSTLHRKSLAPMMTSHAVVDEFGQHTRWAFPLKGIEKLNETDPGNWPLRPPAAVSHTIFPGTVVIVNPVDAQFIRVDPADSPDKSVVVYHGVYDESSDPNASREAYDFGGDIFSQEDLPISEQCQRGMSAGLKSVMIGKNEPVVQLWHRRWHAGIE